MPSILRGFSAPVILEYDYSDAQLLTLLAVVDRRPVPSILRGFSAPVMLRAMTTATPSCSRCWPTTPTPSTAGKPASAWRCARAIRAIAVAGTDARDAALDDAYIDAMRSVLRDPALDAAFKELVLTLPSETYIAEQLDVVDPQRMHAVREAMRAQLATALLADWEWAYEAEPRHRRLHAPTRVSSGRRALAGMALDAPVPGGARRAATRSGRARRCSASRTRAT